MYQKIVELIMQEDTFKLYSIPDTPYYLPHIKTKIPLFRTLHEFRSYMVDFFKHIIINSQEEDLIYYESFKMLNYIEKIFGEVLRAEDAEFDITDEIIAVYQDTILQFTEDIKDEIITEHVKKLLS